MNFYGFFITLVIEKMIKNLVSTCFIREKIIESTDIQEENTTKEVEFSAEHPRRTSENVLNQSESDSEQ